MGCIMKKRIAATAMLIILLVAIILIVNTKGNVNNKPISGKVVIWNSACYNDYLQKRIDKIAQGNNKIFIEVFNKSEEEILEAIEGNSEEKPDIAILNSKYMNEIDATKVVSTDYILQDYQNNFYKGRLKECKDKLGINIGIPLSTNPQMLFIDKQYIEQYGSEQILTWNDFLDFGKSIVEKLNEDEAVLSLTNEEYKKFIEILYIQQGIGSTIKSGNEKIEGIKVNTIDFINKLKEEKILSVNSNKKSICSIGSNAKYQKILKNNGKENTISMELPVFILGANGSVTLQGDNYIILSENKKELIKFVLINLFTDFDNILPQMNDGEFFISYSKAYKLSEFGEKPYPQMINVESRAIEVDYRDVLNELIEETINL